MNKTSSKTAPQKKYWWLLLLVLPIVLALIAIIPELLKRESTPQAQPPPSPAVEQNAENVQQSTGQGNNFNNVQGNITIASPLSKDAQKP